MPGQGFFLFGTPQTCFFMETDYNKVIYPILLMETQTRRVNEFTESMLQMVRQNWLPERTLTLVKEACEWIETNLPSLTDFDEKLRVFQLYTSSQMIALENSNLKLGNENLRVNELRMESLFQQQKEVLGQQADLISNLSKLNADKNDRIKELQSLLQSSSQINPN